MEHQEDIDWNDLGAKNTQDSKVQELEINQEQEKIDEPSIEQNINEQEQMFEQNEELNNEASESRTNLVIA